MLLLFVIEERKTNALLYSRYLSRKWFADLVGALKKKLGIGTRPEEKLKGKVEVLKPVFGDSVVLIGWLSRFSARQGR